MNTAALFFQLHQRRALRLTAVLVATVGLSAASVEARTLQASDPLGPSVVEVARLVATQARALEEQQRALETRQREIESLRKLLDEIQKLALVSHNRLEQMAKAPPAPTGDAAVEERLARIEEAVNHMPDLPTDAVEAGDDLVDVRRSRAGARRHRL